MKRREYVGYGHPPKKSRFKPGQSGNPKGRPKKEPSSIEDDFSKVIQKRLKQKVSIQIGDGREKRVSLLEAYFLKYEQVVMKTGTARDFAQYLAFIVKYDKAGPASEFVKIIVEGGLPRNFTRTEFDKRIDTKSLNRLRKRSANDI